MDSDRTFETLQGHVGGEVIFLEHSYAVPLLGILRICVHNLELTPIFLDHDFEVVSNDGNIVSFSHLDVDFFLKDKKLGINQDTIYGQPYTGNCFLHRKENKVKE